MSITSASRIRLFVCNSKVGNAQIANAFSSDVTEHFSFILDAYDSVTRSMSRQLNMVVVSIEYVGTFTHQYRHGHVQDNRMWWSCLLQYKHDHVQDN